VSSFCKFALLVFRFPRVFTLTQTRRGEGRQRYSRQKSLRCGTLSAQFSFVMWQVTDGWALSWSMKLAPRREYWISDSLPLNQEILTATWGGSGCPLRIAPHARAERPPAQRIVPSRFHYGV